MTAAFEEYYAWRGHKIKMYAIQHMHSCTVIRFQFQYVNFGTMLLGNNDSGNMPTQDVTS